jgi:uncharacterized RDD family membrane protein YckC
MDDAVIIQTAQNVDLAFSPAGLGERLLAWLADALIGAAYWIAVIWLFSEVGAPDGATAMVLVMLPPLLYPLLCEVLFEGQTAGKRLLRIQVARLDGAPPTLGQYLLRWMLRLLDVTFSMGVVAVVAIAATSRSQRLGDVVAGTTVIRQRRRVRLDDVRYPERPPGQRLAVPEAERLSDADVRTLRAVLVRLRQDPRSSTTRSLGLRAKAAVERRLGLAPAAMSPEAFLELVVADYTAAHDRYAG